MTLSHAATPQNSHANAPKTVTLTGSADNTLYADCYGDPANPPILLLHGGGQTRHAWSGSAKRLADNGYYAVTLDARGHGNSDWLSNGDYTANGFISDLPCVIEQLKLTSVILVGASMGGLTSLVAVGEKYISNARAVVLVDIAPRLENKGVERVLAFMRTAPNGFASLEEARDAIAAYNPHRPPPKSLSGLKKNLRQRDDGRYYWHWDPRFLQQAEHRQEGEALIQEQRRYDAAKALDIPVLLIRGVQSDVVSEAGARELLELIPHAKWVELKRAGHMVAGDRNDVFSDAVHDFIKALPDT